MRVLLAVAVVVGVVQESEAGPLRRRNQPQPSQSSYSSQSHQSFQSSASGSTFQSSQSSQSQSFQTSYGGSSDALDEVNAARARRGLRPFMPDPALTQAALSCAQTRASRGIRGHLSNDFVALPPGANARAAGCGALEPSWGWGTCCTYESFTYAGAAWVMGGDGRRYMHIFVR